MPISTPTQIAVPFATSGLKNAIPAASDPVNGHAGYDKGFTAINMTPRTAGGIPPFGQDFNGIFFDISTALQFLEAGGGFPYNLTFATAVGGYPLGALVSRTDGTGLWRNTVANNTTDPEAFGAGWQPEDAGSTAIVMTNANVTMTALQAARAVITITGVLTANLRLILPTYVKQWLIVNNCTGSFTITVKTAAGSGVSVNAGVAQAIYGDGTNIGSSFVKGISRFTASGSFTVPPGVYNIYASGCAGGGGGGGSIGVGASTVVSGAGGGAAGDFLVRQSFPVTPGQVLTVTIGTGGAAGGVGGNGGNGGVTSLGALFTLAAGTGGLTSTTAASSSVAPGPPGGIGVGGEGGTGCDSNSSGGGFGGIGANGPYGNGGVLVRGVVGGATIPGKTARGFGGGGGGAGGVYGGVVGGTGSTGGAGGGGLLIIEW